MRGWAARPATSQALAAPASKPSDDVLKIIHSGLIDLEYYNLQLDTRLPDLASAAQHYIALGAANGINPNCAFDTVWYVEKYQKAGKPINPLIDYIDNGEKRRRNPSPGFNRSFYLSAHRDVAATGVDPLRHFIRHGQAEGRITSPSTKARSAVTSNRSQTRPGQDVLRIIHSGLIDLEYYNLQLEVGLPDLASAAQHYVAVGAATGINPNCAFDTAWYLENYQEAGEAINPLLDYIDNGEKRQRNPSPGFDRLFYLSVHRDVAATGTEPLRHFVEHGQSEGRVTSPFVQNEKTPTRFRGLFSELLPQDGVVTFEGVFQIKPVKDSSAEVLKSDYLPARVGHQDPGIQNSAIAQLYPAAPYIAHFKDVAIVGGTRLILPDTETVLSDEINAFKSVPGSSIRPHSYFIDNAGNLRTPLSRRYPSRTDRGIHAMHEYAANYFHFLVEVLPRIFLADQMELPRDIPLLIQAGLAKNLRVLLDCVNINRREIIELADRQLYKIKEVYFVSDASSIQDVYLREREPAETILHLELLRDVVKYILGQYSTTPAEKPGRRRRIFVRRGQRYRGLRNESDIEDFLVEQGFELVSTDDLSVRSQINIFRDAELVLCPTGAAATNMLWCRPRTEVHVFMSDHIATPTEIWTQLGSVSGCRVRVTKCERAFSNDGKYAMHDDYYADIDTVRKIVEEFRDGPGANHHPAN